MSVGAQTLARLRSVNIPSGSLLTFAMLAGVTGAPLASIHFVGWAPGTQTLFAVAILAILFAWWLSRCRMSSWLIVGIGVVSDITVAYIVASEAFPGPTDGLSNFVALFGDTIEWVQLRQSGEINVEQPLGVSVGESWELLRDLYFRLENWFRSAFAFQVSRDNVVFLFWMTMAAWGMGFFCSWAAYRRHSPLLALIPGALALGINITYVGPDWVPFVIFLSAALGLTVHLRVEVLESKWTASGMHYSSRLGRTVLASTIGVIALVVVLSVALPRATENPVAEAFWTYLGDDWSTVETGIQRLFGGVSNPAGAALAGRESLQLHGPQPFRPNGTMIIESTSPHYWRGQTFDIYTGQDWRSTYRELTDRKPGQPIEEAFDLKARVPVRTNIEMLGFNTSVLVAPGEVVHVNRDYLVQVEDAEDRVQDYASIRATRRAGHRLVYSVDSTVSDATIEQLRNAPTEYPDWVRTYLELPTMPERVKQLAFRLGEIGDNVFDRVLAVEFFMRRFPFAVDVPELPGDRDATDYFIFEARSGSASMIASTMAVLVRALDIPSRIVNGFVFGDYDAPTNRFFVNPEHAHTWVEVYFPNYGWLAFEPSGFRIPVQRSTAAGSNHGSQNPNGSSLGPVFDNLVDELELMGGNHGSSGFSPLSAGEPSAVGRFFGNIFGLLVALGVILGIVALTLLSTAGVSAARNHLEAPSTSVQRTYARMMRTARRAGYNATAAETPEQTSQRLRSWLFPASETIFVEGLSPPEAVTTAYMRATYSQHRVTRSERRAVDREWQIIRKRLLLHTFRPGQILDWFQRG